MFVCERNWMLRGEMWAEMATNYFRYAESSVAREWLFATDAGYIPFPQRLIAVTGYLLQLPNKVIPYFYTWIAAALSAICMSLFCLPYYRPVLKDDWARFFICVFLTVTIDFETRTFINFSYLFTLVVALFCLRVLARPDDSVPVWGWIFPILVLSKPAVLTVMPLVVWASIRARSRTFRLISVAMLVAAFAQLWQIHLSQQAGVMPFQAAQSTVLSKLTASGLYSLGHLVEMSVGLRWGACLAEFGKFYLVVPGVVVVVILLGVGLKARASSRNLMAAGAILLFGNTLLNCVALSSEWRSDLDKLLHPYLYRHVIVSYWGVVLILTGLWSTWARCWEDGQRHILRRVGLGVLVGWWCLTGWFWDGVSASKEFQSPLVGNSKWQLQAERIRSGKRPLCVPVDPFAWGMYGEGCNILNGEMALRGPWKYQLVDQRGLLLPIPDSVKGRQVFAMGVVVRTVGGGDTSLGATIRLDGKAGTAEKRVNQKLTDKGGVLFFDWSEEGGFLGSQSDLRVQFDRPVEVMLLKVNEDFTPAVTWMGDRKLP